MTKRTAAGDCTVKFPIAFSKSYSITIGGIVTANQTPTMCIKTRDKTSVVLYAAHNTSVISSFTWIVIGV